MLLGISLGIVLSYVYYYARYFVWYIMRSTMLSILIIRVMLVMHVNILCLATVIEFAVADRQSLSK